MFFLQISLHFLGVESRGRDLFSLPLCFQTLEKGKYDTALGTGATAENFGKGSTSCFIQRLTRKTKQQKIMKMGWVRQGGVVKVVLE